MSQTLTRLDDVPEWVREAYAKIDRLELTGDSFMPDAKLRFGTAQVEGVEAIKAFFTALDTPLITQHWARECWNGGNTVVVLGEAVISRKDEPEKTVHPPFFHMFTMSEDQPEKVASLLIIVGPVNPEKGLL